MTQKRLEQILDELNFKVEKLEDETNLFNIAIKAGGRNVHFLAPRDDIYSVWAVCSMRLSDAHWAALVHSNKQERGQFYRRVHELLLLRGVRYGFGQEQAADSSPRVLQASCRVDVDDLSRSSVHNAINEVVDGGALFSNVVQGMEI